MEQGRDSSTLVLYVIGALLLVVGAAWLFLSLRDAPPPPPQIAAPVPTALEIPGRIDPQFELQQNLDMAEMAFSAGQLVEPANGSALYFFLAALTQDADNTAAREGLARIGSAMAVRAGEQLAGEEFVALGDSLRVLQRIDAADPALINLRAQLDEVIAVKLAVLEGAILRGQWEPAQALIDQLLTVPGVDAEVLALRQQELATALGTAVEGESVAPVTATAADAAGTDAAAAGQTPPRPVASPAGSAAAETDTPVDGQADDTGGTDFGAALGARAAERLAAGQLLLPADDSAAYYLRELRRAAPSDPALASGISDLIDALSQRALASAQAGRYDEAQSLLDAAASFGVQDERLTAVAARIVAQRIALEGARVLPAGEMVNTRVVRPRYPIRALRNNTEGYVLLNFTVLTDGTTDEIEVVESSDKYADQFRRMAVAAVAQWEFVPREFLGQVIEQRVQARVTFEINQ